MTSSEDRTMQTERLARNFAEYEHYLKRAQGYFEQGEHAAAAMHAALASHIAVQNHCGVFWGPRLEKLLTDIGRAIPSEGPPAPRKKDYRRILQVSTQVAPVGGLTKMLCLWVGADKEREHTLVLTQHRGPVPDFVHTAFDNRVHHLNHSPGGHIEWAKRLRAMARDYDLVILHTHCEDVVPLIAFAEPGDHVPVLVLNHADHLFWFGPSVCHLAIDLRDAALDLAVARRDIAPERNILMPTISEGVTRTRSREEAKRELGLDPDTVLMVSVARQLKYKTMHGITYADIHAPVLEKYPNVSLLVVGAGDQDDWAPVKAKVGDRLRTTPQLPNPKVYFEAADIYVDSYPFVSSTSMMEAAGYGAPGVTIFTYPKETSIFGINHVALVGRVLQARSFDEYREMLERLINDPALREKMAVEAREAVAREHNAPGWMRWLEGVYARAAELPVLDNRAMLQEIEAPSFGEPDWRHEDIFGGDWPVIQLVKSYLPILPYKQRMAHWREVRDAGAFRTKKEAASYLMPEWFKRFVKDGILKLPEEVTLTS